MALGLATTLVAFLTMKGFQQNIEQKLTGFSGHLQVTKYSLNRSYEFPPWDKSKLQGLQQEFPGYIQAIKAFAHKTLLLQASHEVEGIVCRGLDPEARHENLQIYLTAGRMIAFSPQGYSQELVLSNQTANRLNVQVGDQVMACVIEQSPRYRKLKVVGLYTTSIADIDEKIAFCDLRLIQRLNNWPETLVGGYEIFLHHLGQTKEVAAKMFAWLDHDLGIQTTQNAYAPIFDWLAIVRKNVLIFMTLILLITSSNLASIVLIQMMERTSMIGLLKALGATNRQIQQIMLWNNMHLVAKGLFGGNLIGIGLCALQHYTKFLALDPTYYYTKHVPIAWNWHIIVSLNLLTFAVATTVLVLSIAIIARIRPLQAIHFR